MTRPAQVGLSDAQAAAAQTDPASRLSLEEAELAFRGFVMDPNFPCLGGKGALRQGGCKVGVYGELGAGDATGLAADLAAFADSLSHAAQQLAAFVAIFQATRPLDERRFELRLWKQLQTLHQHDESSAGWDPAASDDPDDPRFAFSFAGHAFFVIGLHPDSSRMSRRFRWPALVFNPHQQFDRLRAEGKYERLRDHVRARDIALQGTPNPNLSDFGERSEARQYSGRKTEAEWRCPFHRREADSRGTVAPADLPEQREAP
jgi:FPC/CPF motif-containing protein YcgG